VLRDREDVDRLALAVEVEHRAEDVLVALEVEVLGPQVVRDDVLVHRLVRQQHGAEDGLLGLHGVRRRDALDDVGERLGLREGVHRAGRS
jgi:hypothetical protein